MLGDKKGGLGESVFGDDLEAFQWAIDNHAYVVSETWKVPPGLWDTERRD